MNIVVLVKQVPDTEGDRKLDPSDNTLDRASVDPVINYIDEFAIEEGLRLKEEHGGEVTILTVGPERATESIRKALSMGADKAVHVTDEALHGSDAIATAKVIAKTLGTVEWDVAIAGSEATDSRSAIVPAEPVVLTGDPGQRPLTGQRQPGGRPGGAERTRCLDGPSVPSLSREQPAPGPAPAPGNGADLVAEP